MRLDRRWIEAHLVHAGSMCLLDEVVTWDAQTATCRSGTHRDADNPLRAHGLLGSACGIEYAAQAMAVHGALLAAADGSPVPAGLLASVRDVHLLVARLDDVSEDLIAWVERIAGDAHTTLYAFTLSAGNRRLVHGRAAIAFRTESFTPLPHEPAP